MIKLGNRRSTRSDGAVQVSQTDGGLSTLLRATGTFFCVGGLALAISWTLRIGLADLYFQQNTLQGTEKAIRLTPGQAEYQDDLANFYRDDQEQRAIQILQHAVELNPYDADAWIHLGLIHERESRLSEASRDLHQAAHVDRTFLPAWSLANFYFRQNNSAQFWFWIHQASRLVPEDASPLFRLCWHFTDDGNEIGKQLDLDRPDMQAQYINFLIAEKRIVAVQPVALGLAASNRNRDTPLLLNTLDWLISQQQEGAVTLWNLLAAQHRIPYQGLHPHSRPTTINADFMRSPTSVGFDWHLPDVAGINASQASDRGGLRLEFSGDQPESAEILTQVLAVEPNTAYTFMVDYSTSGIAPESGLKWEVVNLTASSLLASTEGLSSDHGAVARLNFAVPADSRFVRVALVYQRALGTTRIEGSLVLHTIGLAITDSSETKE